MCLRLVLSKFDDMLCLVAPYLVLPTLGHTSSMRAEENTTQAL